MRDFPGADPEIENVPTVVIGGGQAGLVMGYHLQQAGEKFVILDAGERVGDAWRNRWDSLRLFSLPRYASLPGLPIATRTFPTADEMADYLEDYAEHFQLPVRLGSAVRRLSRDGAGFRIEVNTGAVIHADRVVVCTGGCQTPWRPGLAAELSPTIHALHSADYRSADDLRGDVLLVGAGNSGADIALEARAAGHRTWLAGRHPGEIPFRIETQRAKLLVPLVMFAFRRVLTTNTPIGRKVRGPFLSRGTNLVRVKLADLDAAGVQRVGRVERVVDGQPVVADGTVLYPDTVVWCTGFRNDFSWIDFPVADEHGSAQTERGVGPVRGLFFLGQEFQFSAASSTIQGLDQDARYVRRAIQVLADQGTAAEPQPSLR